jgi:hypothetical protein
MTQTTVLCALHLGLTCRQPGEQGSAHFQDTQVMSDLQYLVSRLDAPPSADLCMHSEPVDSSACVHRLQYDYGTRTCLPAKKAKTCPREWPCP